MADPSQPPIIPGAPPQAPYPQSRPYLPYQQPPPRPDHTEAKVVRGITWTWLLVVAVICGIPLTCVLGLFLMQGFFAVIK